MKAIITGTTGMVGKGVLLECLESEAVEQVLVINRRSIGLSHPKLKEIIHKDFYDLSAISDQLIEYNACFFCMGVSAVGMSEEKYTKITHDLTVSFAKTVLDKNPGMTFCYVSGTGTDSSEKGRSMWARVKGRTENALLAMPFKEAYMFRPGYIQPMKGVKSATGWYNTMYVIFKPLYPLFKRIAPKMVTSSVNVGQAMINAVIIGYEKQHLENVDINLLAKRKA